jgi:hypothetical protein
VAIAAEPDPDRQIRQLIAHDLDRNSIYLLLRTSPEKPYTWVPDQNPGVCSMWLLNGFGDALVQVARQIW